MLLEARKHPVLERLYAAYGRRILRRAFARVWVGGAAWPEGSGPSLAFLNHSAWWDPVLTLFLSHDLFRRDGYGIMQGAQLERYPFFRRIGCFGVTQNSLVDARAVSDYAARVLSGGERRTLWVFPQGELLPARGPVRFRSGVARLAAVAHALPLIPVAVRYEFRGEQRPECVVRVGAAITAAGHERPIELTRRLEDALRRELAELDRALAAGDLTDYGPVLDGQRSQSQLYERTFGRVSQALQRGGASGGAPHSHDVVLPIDARNRAVADRGEAPPAGPPVEPPAASPHAPRNPSPRSR
jgi:1-acyl-sn-glycerol-3-phosphate acyltransferase